MLLQKGSQAQRKRGQDLTECGGSCRLLVCRDCWGSYHGCHVHGSPLPTAVVQAGLPFQVAVANTQAPEMMALAIGPPEGVPLDTWSQQIDSPPHAPLGTIGATAPHQQAAAPPSQEDGNTTTEAGRPEPCQGYTDAGWCSSSKMTASRARHGQFSCRPQRTEKSLQQSRQLSSARLARELAPLNHSHCR